MPRLWVSSEQQWNKCRHENLIQAHPHEHGQFVFSVNSLQRGKKKTKQKQTKNQTKPTQTKKEANAKYSIYSSHEEH